MGFRTYPGADGSTPTLGGEGLALVTTASFTAVSSVSVNQCFTAAYLNYEIVFSQLLASADSELLFRLRLAGSDAATSYTYEGTFITGATVGASRTSASTSGKLGSTHDANQNAITAWLYQPALAVRTAWNTRSLYGSGGASINDHSGIHDVATAYDGITVFPSSGTFTGTISIYAYQRA